MTEFAQQLINGLALGSIYALIALGYTMVYGVLRFINFAHGDVYMLGAMSGYYLAHALHPHSSMLRFLGVLIFVMVLCALLGALIERVAYRPLRKAPRLSMLITAIGVSLFIEYAGQLFFGADPKFFPELIKHQTLINFEGVVISNIQLMILCVGLLLMFLLRFLVMNTKMGKAMRAVSFSHQASQFVGININSVITLTFMIGSALAGAAGVLVSVLNPKVEPLMGIMPGLKAFVAAVLGGIGSIPGALIGGFIMGISETFISASSVSTYRDALAFVLLIIILLVRPTGLLGKTTKEKV